MSEVAINIRANDRASATLDHVSRKMGLFNKQGLMMGVGFAGITMGIQMAMQAVQGFIQGIDEAFNKAREFERGMAEVATMLDENAEQHLPAMREGLEELSTSMGLAAGDLQRGLYQTLSASVDAADAMDFLGDASKAAVAGLTSVETSVDALTTVMNAYGMTTFEVGRISDIMFTTVYRGKTTFEELAQSIGYVVPIAAQAGVAFEEIAAAMATLTKQGIKSERAVTGLRALITQIISPSKEATEAAAKYGIILNDLSLEVLGISGLMEKFTEATGGSAGALSEMIPNIRALTAAVGLGGDNLGSFTFDLNAMQTAIGATDDAFSDMAENLDTKFRIMEQRLEAAKRELGLDPSVIQAKKTLNEWEIAVTKTQAKIVRGFFFAISAATQDYAGMAKAFYPPDISDILEDWEDAFTQETITLDLNQLLEFEGAENMASKLTSLWDATELDADTLIGYMNEWGREIDSTTNLISRLENEVERLDMQIGDLNLQLSQYDNLKQYEEALHYIPIALEDGAYATKIFDSATQALVDSIRIQKDEIEALDRANNQYAINMRGNQLEALEIQLKAMGRRGRLTRSEQNRLKDLKKSDLEYRIATLRNQTSIDKIKNDGLSEDQERLEEIRRNYQEEIKIIKDSQDTTRRDMEWDLQQKKTMRDTYEDDYLPKVRQKHVAALDKYHAGLLLIENKWTGQMIAEWEGMAGSIAEKKIEILAAKAAIAGKPIAEGTTYTPASGKGGIPQWKWEEKVGVGSEETQSVNSTVAPTTEGGFLHALLSLFPPMWGIGFQSGTDYVPKTGYYKLHEGESVTPAGGKVIHVSFDEININAHLTKNVDVAELGNTMGQAIAAGAISELESQWSVG